MILHDVLYAPRISRNLICAHLARAFGRHFIDLPEGIFTHEHKWIACRDRNDPNLAVLPFPAIPKAVQSESNSSDQPPSQPPSSDSSGPNSANYMSKVQLSLVTIQSTVTILRQVMQRFPFCISH